MPYASSYQNNGGFFQKTERDKAGWNINSWNAYHITLLIQRATNYYLQGELHDWFWAWTAIREMINYNLDKAERDKLDNMENAVIKIDKRNRNLFTREVRLYQREIMDLLKVAGFLPPKQDRSRLGF